MNSFGALGEGSAAIRENPLTDWLLEWQSLKIASLRQFRYFS